MYAVSAEYKAALATSHTRLVKVERLDDALQVIATVTPVVLAGSVEVAVGQDGARRTLSMEIANEDGTYTPRLSTDPFAANGQIRVWLGVVLASGAAEYAPVGVFMVNRPWARPRAGTLEVTAVDRWKKLRISKFFSVASFAVGATLKSVFESILDGAGITAAYRSIDPSAGSVTLRGTVPLQFRRGFPRADALMTFYEAYSWDMWFDPLGIFVMRPTIAYEAQPAVFEMADTDPGCEELAGGFEDSEDIVNHTGVASTSTDVQPIFAEAKDLNQNSPTWVDGPFGDRFDYYEDQSIQTAAIASDVAKGRLRRSLLGFSRRVEYSGVPLPHLDVYDVGRITSADLRISALPYMVDRISLPLRLESATIGLAEIRALP